MKVRMKKLIEISITTVLLLLILLVPQANAQVVDIPDDHLEAVIRAHLGIFPPDPLTETDLAMLTHLNAWSDGIVDLTGLEHCVNLTDLNLGVNGISEISPLLGLTNLVYLHLGHNNISDLSALSGLTNLEELNLYNNYISDSDIGALSGLSNLRRLILMDSYNKFSDISPLSGLTNLEQLSLNGNNINDISALSGLTNLESLNIALNRISDISALSGLTNLQTLFLEWNQISDITALSGMTNLERLYAARNTISDITVISGLTNLVGLHLSDNNINNISAVSGLTNLEWLNLRNNNVSNIQSLVDNLGVSDGDRVDLTDNPLGFEAIYTDIPILLARGVAVRYDDLPSATLIKVSGDGQTGEPGSTLPDPFVVQVLDQNSDPFEGVLVTFSVIEGGGSLNLETTTTGADGLAGATLTLGPDPGTNRVEVTAAGVATPVTFDAIAEDGSNTAPMAISDTATTPMNTSVAFNVLDNDVDPDPGDVIVVVAFTQPSHGILTLDLETGECLYLPDEDFVGSDLFTYDISDGELLSESATVTITVTGAASPVVDIPDPGLEAAIREELGIGPSDPITEADLTGLTYLDAGERDIIDLTGLEYCVNLQLLQLKDNNISNISVLSELTNLDYLHLSNNNINDIKSLVNNPGLDEGDYVNLTSNPLKNKAINMDIPILIARGVDVRYDKPPGQSVTIRGTVYDALTLDVLPGVQIKVGKKKILTDSNGKYILGGLPTGKIKITASKDGYDDETQTLPYTLSVCEAPWTESPYYSVAFHMCDGPTGDIPLYMAPKGCTTADSGFRPISNGFHFINPPGWALFRCGIVPNQGYCAGMAHAALDLWHDKTPPNPKSDTSTSADYGWPVPDDDQSLFVKNTHHEFCGSDTLAAVLEDWLLFPSVPDRVANSQIKDLKEYLEREEPQPIVLGSLLGSGALRSHHSVLAYRLVRTQETCRIWIYDPNKPEKESAITLVKPQAGSVWFMAPYDHGLWGKLTFIFSDYDE